MPCSRRAASPPTISGRHHPEPGGSTTASSRSSAHLHRRSGPRTSPTCVPRWLPAGSPAVSPRRSVSTRSAPARRSRRPTPSCAAPLRARDTSTRPSGARRCGVTIGVREGANRQLLLPTRRRRRRAAAAEARAVPAGDGHRDARARARRPALAAPRRRASRCRPRRGCTAPATSASAAESRQRSLQARRVSSGAVTQARLQLRRLVVPDENATWAPPRSPPGSGSYASTGSTSSSRPRRRLDAPDRGSDRPRDGRPLGRRPARLARRACAPARGHHRARRRRRRCTSASPASSPRVRMRSRASPRRSRRRPARSGRRGRVVTIPNGWTSTTSRGSRGAPSDRFRLTHTGSFFGRRDPRPFLQALHDSGSTSSPASSATSVRPTARGPRRPLRSGTVSSSFLTRHARSRSRCSGTRRRCCC